MDMICEIENMSTGEVVKTLELDWNTEDGGDLYSMAFFTGLARLDEAIKDIDLDIPVGGPYIEYWAKGFPDSQHNTQYRIIIQPKCWYEASKKEKNRKQKLYFFDPDEHRIRAIPTDLVFKM